MNEWMEPFFLSSQILFVNIYTTNAEKAMAPHSRTLAWEIPWAEEPNNYRRTEIMIHHWGVNPDSNLRFWK